MNKILLGCMVLIWTAAAGLLFNVAFNGAQHLMEENSMPLSEISKDTAKTLQEWLHEDKVSAAEHDPSVGIFGNDDLAEAFTLLQSYVEEQTGVGAP